MKSALPGILRLIAILLLIGGVVLGILDAYGAARAPVALDESFAVRLPALAEAVAMVLGLVGLAALLYGLATILDTPAAAPSDNGESRRLLAELRQSVTHMESAIDRLAEQGSDPVHHTPANLGDVTSGDTVAGASVATSESMHQVILLLQEIRELAMLSDAQRQQRTTDAQQHRRNALLAEIQRLSDAKDWVAAENVLTMLDKEFPNDSALAEVNSRLAAGKREAERNAFGQLRERVEDLMAVWAWDQAYSETAHFVEMFPDHDEGQELLTRVMRARDDYIESTANVLYEEIKADIDRRLWRRAMINAVKLLECAPGHRRSVAIRSQIKTIRENAEIEERQEQERRIQELIRGKNFPDAIELAEDLLRRFPNSPQAESLQQLLPKMRELAIGNELEAEAPVE
jgi:outer membrane protein assembly factor BamD (BamD/ComL family)